MDTKVVGQLILKALKIILMIVFFVPLIFLVIFAGAVGNGFEDGFNDILNGRKRF